MMKQPRNTLENMQKQTLCPKCNHELWPHLWDKDRYYCDECDQEYEFYEGMLREIDGRWLVIKKVIGE